MDEDIKKEQPPVEDQIEEELPPEQDLGGEDQFTPEPELQGNPRLLNKVIPSVIAQVVFAPAAVAADGAPPDPQQLAAQYVAMTSQILDLVDFQDCLGGMGELSKTTRLIIGVVALAGGVFLMKPQRAKVQRSPRADNDKPKPSEHPTS